MANISGSYPLPSMVYTGAGVKYFHVKQNGSQLESIGGLTLSVPTGLVVHVDITHNTQIGDSTLGESEWVRVGTSITGPVEFPYKTGSCMGIRVTRASGTGEVRGEVTEFSGGGGGTVSSPSVVQLSHDLAGENTALNRSMTAPAFNFTRVAGAATTLVKTGEGICAGVFVEVTTQGTVTLYDAITATGTPPLILPIGTLPGFQPFPWAFSTGFTAVTSHASDRVSYGWI